MFKNVKFQLNIIVFKQQYLQLYETVFHGQMNRNEIQSSLSCFNFSLMPIQYKLLIWLIDDVSLKARPHYAERCRSSQSLDTVWHSVDMSPVFVGFNLYRIISISVVWTCWNVLNRVVWSQQQHICHYIKARSRW